MTVLVVLPLSGDRPRMLLLLQPELCLPRSEDVDLLVEALAHGRRVVEISGRGQRRLQLVHPVRHLAHLVDDLVEALLKEEN